MAKEDGLTGWLERVRKTGEYSDVRVRVDGEEFRLHMLPLMNASAYFRNLPSSSDGSDQAYEAGGRVVTIHELPGGVEGFTAAVDICYLLKPNHTVQNVSLIYAAAEFLGMDEVVESTKIFMRASVFSHWRFCINFLQLYNRVGSPVDQYVESNCQKVLVTAAVKSFAETKHLSAPANFLSGPLNVSIPLKHFSPCQTLTELLVQICSLPDVYAVEIIDTLVDANVNLNLKCRQGRNVRSWLDSVMEDECRTDQARCWVLLWLSRMLLKGAPAQRPWMELSSIYWCSLLEYADNLLPLVEQMMKERLIGVKSILEEKIGESLDELDEYLHDYKLGPETLLSLVEYYNPAGGHSEQSLHEIAEDVDSFLWQYAEEGCIPVDMFLNLLKSIPPSLRSSHDTIYGAIEKLLSNMTDVPEEEQQQLWAFIDHFKLSPCVSERALNNPNFLGQPEMLECVLQHHSQELSKVDNNDGGHLRIIMHKVINASLKLLEENSRRSREINELQKQYGQLLDCKAQILDNEEVVDILKKNRNVEASRNNSLMRESESEGSDTSETPSIATVSSTVVGSGRRRVAEMFRDDPDCSSASC